MEEIKYSMWRPTINAKIGNIALSDHRILLLKTTLMNSLQNIGRKEERLE